MKISKLQIENYRLLKNFSVDLEKELSLIIGKNNTGKTSILSILDKFLSQSDKNKFTFDDFNIDFKSKLKTLIENPAEVDDPTYIPLGIRLKVFINYDEEDSLANVSRVMMNLDPTNNVIVLGFEYVLHFDDLLRLKNEYATFLASENAKQIGRHTSELQSPLNI